MFRLDNEIALKHCPCSIEFISKWNVYLVATYELDEQTDNERINKRHGSLALIKSDDHCLIQEFDCKNGGVFDFRLLLQFPSKQDDCVHLYTAHSNGHLSYFKLIRLDDDKYELNELESLDTGSTMLTCLDLLVVNGDRSSVYVLTGDSCSTITIFKDLKLINRIRIADIDYPIWCLKTMLTNDHQRLLFIGSDDCLLRCLVFDNEFQVHFQLFSNKSFEGGVTSIELQAEENEATVSNYKVLVGSYDEKLRIFKLNLNLVDFNNRTTQSSCIRVHTILSISNAGIWKVKLHSPFHLITGMYSGVHLVKDDQLIYSFNDLPIDEGNKIEKLESEHLVYGCCLNNNLDQLLITSFYKKRVYVLNVDKELMFKL